MREVAPDPWGFTDSVSSCSLLYFLAASDPLGQPLLLFLIFCVF